jgi:hypothetical protein
MGGTVMSFRQDYGANSASTDNDPAKPPYSSHGLDDYELVRTLNSYEVEEFDGHALARFLPTIALAEGCQEPLIST